jgi:hypothetical protein
MLLYTPGELYDSEKLAFSNSHFVKELLPIDYLSNQKQ